MKKKIALTLSFAVTLFTLIAFDVRGTISFSTSESTVVVGTKRKYLWGQSGYLFVHDTSLVFEAPEVAAWTFDYIEVDFGCEVGGVTGVNVSDIFAIDNGYIELCQRG